MPLLSTFFTNSVKTLILAGITYEIEFETLYFVYVVDAIPYWSSVGLFIININNNEICDKFTCVKYYANA